VLSVREADHSHYYGAEAESVRMVELYLHSLICLQCVVFYWVRCQQWLKLQFEVSAITSV
jgi:hypothetical protein